MESPEKGVVSACPFTHLLFIVFLLATILGSTTLVANADEFTPREVLVRFAITSSELQISAFESEYGLTLLHDFERLRMRHYKLPETLSVQEAVEQFVKVPIVELAEPNYYRRLEAIPTDPRFAEQWALHNTGQTVNGFTGPADVDIDWPEARDLFQPAGEVIVAIIDSGVALDHPEIFPNRWLNLGETNFTNGIDDDGNGYIDDRIGWDYADNDNAPLDENGHGTLAASIIGAAIDNGEGSVGVTPNVKIMVLRVLNQLGSTQGGLIDIVTFILATDYAADNGARIINYSIGGTRSSTFEHDQIQSLDTRGILLVAAAGNDGTNNDTSSLPNYPSSYPANNIIAVAAADRTGDLADFSNFGAISVDLAAPGTDIFGADVARVNVFFENFENGVLGWSQASNTPLIWSLYVDPFIFNTWLTDSIDPIFLTPVLYQPNTDSWAMTPPIDLRSGVGARLEYDIVHDFEFLFDGLIVEVSTDDGASWNFADLHTGLGADLGAGQRASVDLSGYAGHIIRVRFNLLADSINQFDGAYIDNVGISQFAVFFYDGSQYQYNSGTSFAAPLVSGVAALLMAQRPDLTHREVRQYILENVDARPELTGQVATGGRLNAHSALASAIGQPVQNTVIVAAVLPTSRSVQVGNTATAFAVIINAGSATATDCGIAPAPPSVQADFSYQTTDASNALIGTPNTPADIAAGGNQNYLFALTPTASFSPVDVQLSFDCANTDPAAVTVGLNTLLFVADSGPVPDIVALGATLTGDGIVNLASTGVFAVATVNVGVAGTITVSADTGSASLPVSVALCETNPATGVCINPTVPTPGTVTTSIAAGATPTFAFFVTGTDTVPFDPANNRIFARFKDAGGVTRGSTSVAVRTL